MRVPSKRFALAGGKLVCEPRDTRPGIVQGHVVKHPFGVTSLVSGNAWDHERWDELGVIDAPKRASFMAQVLRLRKGTAECSVPEIRGTQARSPFGEVACTHCPTALARACEEETAPTMGGPYLGVLEELLGAVSSPTAANVPPETLARQLFGGLRNLAALKDLVVGYGGLDRRNQRSIIVRLNRGDGVRAEFFFEEPDRLAWRTLYRDFKAVSTPNGLLQFLLEAPPKRNSTKVLSEMCLVSRLFWQAR